MLLANISVAKKIFQHFPEFAVLRRHPSPPAANYDILVKAASSKVSWWFRFSRLFRAYCLEFTSCIRYFLAYFLHLRSRETLYSRTKHISLQGVQLEVDTAKSLAVSLDAANVPDEPYFNTLLRIMATRCMMQAVYFCSGMLPEEEFQHYGLATPIYTHFTSPIRRSVQFKCTMNLISI